MGVDVGSSGAPCTGLPNRTGVPYRAGLHLRDRSAWAEYFVPNWIGHSKKSPEYRFIAIREPLREQPLPGLEAQLELLPFPAMRMAGGAWHKVSGLVTNRELAGDEVVRWYRQRCGGGEQVHSVLKSDLAGGRLPSGLFGANAAWWAIAVLAFNLSSAMKPGVGRTVGEQASQGSALRPDRPSGPGDVARQEVDHPSGPGPSLIRCCSGLVREYWLCLPSRIEHRLPCLAHQLKNDSARSPRLGHAFFGLRTAIYGVGPLPIPANTPAKALPTPESNTRTRPCTQMPPQRC